MAKIKKAEEHGLETVDYDLVNGANCPKCGERMKTKNTLPWEDGTRMRYHLCACGVKARSVQMAQPPAQPHPQPQEPGSGFRSDPHHPLSR